MTATRRNPQEFPLDDARIYDAYIAGRQSAALAVGVRSGLFDLLDFASLTAAEVASKLGFRERSTRSLLAALVAMQILDRNDDDPPRHSLTPEARAYLLRGKPGWLGGLIDLEIEHFLSPAALLEAMSRDRPSVYGDADPWETHALDPEAAARFTRAMHSVSERPAAGFAEVVDLTKHRRLLDVGGGSGALSIAIARANPHLECVVWDLPVVCPTTREYIDRAGLAAQVTAREGNMFVDRFPEGFDAVLFSQILHDWTPAQGEPLLRGAHDALPPRGVVLIHEKLVNDDGRGPLANVLVHLDMLVWTEGRQYSARELGEMLSVVGFREIDVRPTAGSWSVVSGRKP